MPFQSKNTTNITLIFERLIRAPPHPPRRPFPHPLRRLRLGFNIVPINPRLVSCYDVLTKDFIIICTGKRFLTDLNTVLFLIVSQQTRHEYYTDATHLKFFSTNLMARCRRYTTIPLKIIRKRYCLPKQASKVCFQVLHNNNNNNT